MKNYEVTILQPAVANLTVKANTREEAVDKAKIMLTFGKDVSFTVEPEDADFFVSEQNEEEPAVPKQFVVSLDAVSHKEVPIHALSEEEAVALVKELYLCTDALDFHDGDVEKVTATVTEG